MHHKLGLCLRVVKNTALSPGHEQLATSCQECGIGLFHAFPLFGDFIGRQGGGLAFWIMWRHIRGSNRRPSIVNRAAINNNKNTFLRLEIHHWINLGVPKLGHMLDLCLIFQETATLILKTKTKMH